MKTTIKVLRGTARALLVLVPAMLVTGLLTARPSLLSPDGFALYRRLHTLAVPLLFVPLVYVHSVVGLRFMLSRSSRLGRPAVRGAMLLLWTLLFAGVAALLLAAATPVGPGGDRPVEGVVVTGDAGPAVRARDGATASADADSDPISEAGAPEAGPPEMAAVRNEFAPRQAPASRSPRAAARPVAPRNLDLSPTETAGAPEPAAAPPEPAAAPAGPELVRARCTGCHGLDEVYRERRSAAGWSAVVGRMMALGARLTDEERRTVVAYLTGR